MSFSKRFRKIWNAAAAMTTGGVPVPPLSYEQAMTFFDKQADRDDLAFGYPQEACFARGHFMCEAALQEGFMPKKAWAVDQEDTGNLHFTMPNGDEIHYWCHTAPALPVKPPRGETLDLVFDPTLLDGPVPLQEWGSVIGAQFYELEIKRLGKPPTNYPGDYNTSLRTTKALSDPNHERHPLQTILRYQPFEVIPRTVFASRYCREEIFPALNQWPVRQGKGWVSVDPFPQPPVRSNPHAAQGKPKDEPKTGG